MRMLRLKMANIHFSHVQEKFLKLINGRLIVKQFYWLEMMHLEIST